MVGAEVTALVSSASKSSPDGLPRTSTRLHDDILLPTNTVKVRSEAKEFVEQVLAPRAAELNSTEESSTAFPYDIMHQMTGASLYAFPFNADVGGRGVEHPMLGAAKVLAELAYYPRGVASALYDSRALLVGRTLDAAPPHIREEFMPRLVRGEIVGSLATSEPMCPRHNVAFRKKEGKQPL